MLISCEIFVRKTDYRKYRFYNITLYIQIKLYVTIHYISRYIGYIIDHVYIAVSFHNCAIAC